MDIPEVDVTTLAGLLANGAPLIDVRQPDEYTEAHVPGAIPLPLGELPERIDEVPPEVTVYVICRSGNRSGKAVEFLRGSGYDAMNVAGGTVAWIEAGSPVAPGEAPG